MGLFQRNPHLHSEQVALYSLGLERTVLIVGLGNKGKKYAKTRHNAGFMAIDDFAKAHDFPAWHEKKDLKSQITTKNLGSSRVILVKPQTMMNLSGSAVRAVADYFKVDTANLIAVYDELDIPFGQIRMRKGGSASGHNGVKSLLEHLDEGFGRVRIGIKAETKEASLMDSADFVLANFSKDEQTHLKAMAREAVSILTEYVYSGSLEADTRSFLI